MSPLHEWAGFSDCFRKEWAGFKDQPTGRVLKRWPYKLLND
jgi:hypothetical protein